MRPHLNDDALEFGEVAAKAFAAAGGVDLARECEAHPSRRAAKVAPMLEQLGITEIDASADAESAEAAAALCTEAGRAALPYPVVGALLAGEGLPVAVVAPGRTERVLIDHARIYQQWLVLDTDGGAFVGWGDGLVLGSRLGPFAGPVSAAGGKTEAALAGRDPAHLAALHLTLTSFVIAGGLAEAVRHATDHVVGRIQFDKPLSSFQAVQFQLADAHVAVAGVEEMAQFALWRCHAAPGEAMVDALAARLSALDSARQVLRISQQLHGAAGVCDEYDVSVITRHLQPALRIPFGADTTASTMAAAAARHGFEGLFPHGGGDLDAGRPA